ncbi:hypothetical protein Tco_0237242 [Tanacetum coccineum]
MMVGRTPKDGSGFLETILFLSPISLESNESSAQSHSTPLVMGLLQLHIEYPLPPAGEGKVDETYEAFCKDLRPSLVWSQEEGWILPTVDGRTAGDAQLIFPSQQGEQEMQQLEAMGCGCLPLRCAKMDDLRIYRQYLDHWCSRE